MRTRERKKKRWFLRVPVIAAEVLALVIVGALIWEAVTETNAVNTTIANYQSDTRAGAASTKKLVAGLSNDRIHAFLADPFFTSPDWKTFTATVTAQDQATLDGMKEQVRKSVQLAMFPWARDRALSFAETMTLSVDSKTRVQLYAATAYAATCYPVPGKPADVTPMFAAGPSGLASKVVAVAKQHCEATDDVRTLVRP